MRGLTEEERLNIRIGQLESLFEDEKRRSAHLLAQLNSKKKQLEINREGRIWLLEEVERLKNQNERLARELEKYPGRGEGMSSAVRNARSPEPELSLCPECGCKKHMRGCPLA